MTSGCVEVKYPSCILLGPAATCDVGCQVHVWRAVVRAAVYHIRQGLGVWGSALQAHRGAMHGQH